MPTAAGYRVVVIDVRGHGRSAKPAGTGAHRMLELVPDDGAVVEALGERSGVIGGHDRGATVAATSALVRPPVRAAEFERTGLTGALNRCRTMDRTAPGGAGAGDGTRVSVRGSRVRGAPDRARFGTRARPGRVGRVQTCRAVDRDRRGGNRVGGAPQVPVRAG